MQFRNLFTNTFFSETFDLARCHLYQAKLEAGSLSKQAWFPYANQPISDYHWLMHPMVTPRPKNYEWNILVCPTVERKIQGIFKSDRTCLYAINCVVWLSWSAFSSEPGHDGGTASGDSRIKKVGRLLRGQGKVGGANKVIYCICIGPMSTKWIRTVN